MLQNSQNQVEHNGPHSLRIPETMPAASSIISAARSADVSVLPVPKVDAGEVLIDLGTAGVGPWDIKVREGLNRGFLLWLPWDREPAGSE